MTLTLIVENGEIVDGANTYISLADAETYFEGRLHKSAWDEATEVNKKATMVQATRILDQYVKWYGSKVKSAQDRQWPMTGYANIDSNAIPIEIKDAECELSLVLLLQDTQAISETAGYKSIAVAGTVNLEIDKSDRIEVIPSFIWKIISHLGSKKGGASILLMRG